MCALRLHYLHHPSDDSRNALIFACRCRFLTTLRKSSGCAPSSGQKRLQYLPAYQASWLPSWMSIPCTAIDTFVLKIKCMSQYLLLTIWFPSPISRHSQWRTLRAALNARTHNMCGDMIANATNQTEENQMCTLHYTMQGIFRLHVYCLFRGQNSTTPTHDRNNNVMSNRGIHMLLFSHSLKCNSHWPEYHIHMGDKSQQHAKLNLKILPTDPFDHDALIFSQIFFFNLVYFPDHHNLVLFHV